MGQATPGGGTDDVVWQQLVTSDVPDAFEAVPLVTIYDDGRIFTTRSGGGFVTALDLGTVPSDELDAFLEDAASSGLFAPGIDFGATGRDTSVGLAVSARIDGKTQTASVADPDVTEVTPGGTLTEAQAARRVDLLALTERARALARDSSPWEPARLLARAAPDPGIGSLPPSVTDQLEPRPWPGPPFDAFAEVSSTWGSCLVIEGEDATAVRRSAETNVTGFWRDGDDVWQIAVRPLLPGQEGCPPG